MARVVVHNKIAVRFLVVIHITLCMNAVERNDVEKRSLQYNNVRLPGNVIPLKYSIYLHPNITDGKFLFTGRVSIDVEAKEETDSIVLHSVSLKHITTTVFELYENETQTGNEGREIEVMKTTKHERHEQAIIHLGRKLSKPKKYRVTIYFSAEFGSALRGFYISTYKTRDGEKRYLAATQFEATGARLAFPCFDEPAMKADFKISIVREKIHTALSNMPVERKIHRPDGLVVDIFKESVHMSTYLVAIVVSDFISLNATSKRGIKVKVWAPRDQISQTKYAIEIAPKMLDYYEQFFNVTFPLPKQDLVAIPDFASYAMENWGLITFRLSALLYDENETSSFDKQNVAATIAHEMAHQWFGNLVTMTWWNDLWLNEGFATFMETIGTDHVSTDWRMEQFANLNDRFALSLDSHQHSHPISVSVEDPADINAIFDTITYLKGSSVIFMMRDFIGNEHFVKGLTCYLETYQYGNANSDDLWKCMSKEASHMAISIKTVMDTWTRQTGYPLITVRRVGEQAHLTQERFISDVKDKNDSTTNYTAENRWNIPLTFYNQKSRDKRRSWFHAQQENVSIPWNCSIGWIKLNVDQIGFYRVNYDEDNWKALATQLNKDHRVFSSRDRASLVDDAFQLANVGRMTYTQALELTEYLNKEEDFVPFSSATDALRDIGDILQSRPGYAAYEKYILRQILPRVKALGWKDEGSHLDRFLRESVMKSALHHKNNDAVQKARTMFKEWMVSGKSIPANLRAPIYYAAIKFGGEKEWDFIYNQYQKCEYPSEKELLLYSLAYSSNVVILKKLLDLTLNKEVIREGDGCFVVMKIARNPVGNDMVYHFLENKWDVLTKRYPAYIGGLIRAVFGSGNTIDDLHKAQDFFKTHHLSTAKLAANQTLAAIRNRIKWLEIHETNVVRWLSKIG